jgi:hypothetical protein
MVISLYQISFMQAKKQCVKGKPSLEPRTSVYICVLLMEGKMERLVRAMPP